MKKVVKTIIFGTLKMVLVIAVMFLLGLADSIDFGMKVADAMRYGLIYIAIIAIIAFILWVDGKHQE